ncbi:MAG: hypothetical protein IJ436_07275 [Bacteroidaceae bacterium]|nr:hypothetical protein [Bacteroidaceae bacterium]
MKTTTLMTIQFLSLILIIGSADGLLHSALSTIIFFASFAAFATCSIYIGEHDKELIRDNNRRYRKVAK